MAVLRMDLEGQGAPEPRPPSNSSDSSEHSGDQRGPSPDLSTFDLADEVGIQAAAKRDANNAVRFLTASSQPVFSCCRPLAPTLSGCMTSR